MSHLNYPVIFGADFMLVTLIHSFSFVASNTTDYDGLLLTMLSDISDRGESIIDRENIELDKDVNNVCDRLRNLDIALTEMCREPPVEGGENMLTVVRTYNQACLDLMFLCSFDKLKVLDMAQDIIEPGGPKFFDVDIDYGKMRERFKWNEEKTDELDSIMKKTYKHWEGLWYIFNNFASP